MKRCSSEQNGLVDFPVSDPAWRNSMEGGMFVRLVVEFPYEDKGWMVCCGGRNAFIQDEIFVGDDISRESPESAELYHFPNMHDVDTYRRYLSKDYIAVVTLGSTGWSGYSDEKKSYWTCSYDCLNKDGKLLYDTFKRQYPDSRIVLQTWLDT